MINLIELKVSENTQNGRFEHLKKRAFGRVWFSCQRGGKDPRIQLSCYWKKNSDTWWMQQIAVVVRKDTVYIVYNQTFDYEIFEELHKLLSIMRSRLQET